jgi:hypothetical protein
VAEDLEGLRVFLSEDAELDVLFDRARQFYNLCLGRCGFASGAIVRRTDLGGEGGVGETRRDGSGDVERSGAARDLAYAAVREFD